MKVFIAGSQTQKGVASYALSANRQGPLKGAFHAAIFNTWRRFSAQVLYFAPPLVAAYAVMRWAIERYGCLTPGPFWGMMLTWNPRNEYLNSKPGRLAEGEMEQ